MEYRLEQKYYDNRHVVPNSSGVPERSPRTCEGVAEDEPSSEVSEISSGMNVLKIVMKHLLMKHKA
eukprot:4261357-Alexandrium_andersonii.AAC.1